MIPAMATTARRRRRGAAAAAAARLSRVWGVEVRTFADLSIYQAREKTAQYSIGSSHANAFPSQVRTPHKPRTMCATSGKVLSAAC